MTSIIVYDKITAIQSYRQLCLYVYMANEPLKNLSKELSSDLSEQSEQSEEDLSEEDLSEEDLSEEESKSDKSKSDKSKSDKSKSDKSKSDKSKSDKSKSDRSKSNLSSKKKGGNSEVNIEYHIFDDME